jgi:hypothetical protein
MKPPARRLGRGLGAFLDFDPAGDDGEAFIEDAIGGAASVLQTSTTAAETVPARAAAPAARAPAPVAVRAPEPPAPVREAVRERPPEPAEEAGFVDDEIVTGISLSAAVPVAPPPAPRAPAPVPAVAVRAPEPPAPVRDSVRESPPEPEEKPAFLDDEIVTGISFPEVDLE